VRHVRIVALGMTLAVVGAGCIADPRPSEPAGPSALASPSATASRPAAASPTPLEATTSPPPPADPVLAKLDAMSRELLGVIEPGELVEATVQTTDPADLVAQAKRRGGRGDVLAPDAALVVAERAVIVAMLRDPAVSSATLGEDLTADRLIATERPVVSIPTPASPYAGRPLPDGQGLADMPGDRRAPLLAALGNAIVTIDGQPYRELTMSGHCQPDLCQVGATGRIGGTGDVLDGWIIESYADRGWLPTLNRSGIQLGAVPRPLARAAEWIARRDQPTARLIARYDSIAGIRWEPSAPGVIEIVYAAECTRTGIIAPPGTKVADHGVCVDGLLVRVDVASGKVVETVQVPDS
jgi:hypothetical protein